MTVVCKVRVQSKTINMEGYTHVRLVGAYSEDPNDPNKDFWDATPMIDVVLTIAPDKPAADYYVNGREYALEFRMVPVHHLVQIDPLNMFEEPT